MLRLWAAGSLAALAGCNGPSDEATTQTGTTRTQTATESTTEPPEETSEEPETSSTETGEEAVNSVSSPDGSVTLTFGLRDSRPGWMVSAGEQTVIQPSPLGLRLSDGPNLSSGLTATAVDTEVVQERWKPVWGAKSEVEDYYTELRVTLTRTEGDGEVQLIGRAYSDGVGLRYHVPEQSAFTDFSIASESTGFRFGGDHTAWWIPDDSDSYESLYNETPLSRVDGAHTPITIQPTANLVYSIHEAAVTDAPTMSLVKDSNAGDTAFEVALSSATEGAAMGTSTPYRTPWRTITIGRTSGDLIESSLILNLNEPARFDASWVEPQKYVGIWWEIHIGKSSWRPGPDLGATTENAKRYIDFAANHDIPALLVEGWNQGWEYGEDEWRGQDFTRPNDEFDLEEVVSYGNQRGVAMIAHVETGGDVDNFERQLEAAFTLYENLGMIGVKTGYAGSIPGGTHHDQRMVNHHRRVIEAAADHGLLVNIHEGIKPTGLRRTYPNLVTSECVRGMEYNAWSDGNPSSHTLTIPFTRMLGGPVDYTPGIFNIDFEDRGRPGAFGGTVPGNQRVHTTRARQLALYPILLSGLQMVADLPENYANQPEFEFIEAVPATWDDTRVVNAAIGRYITVARRSGDEWFVGSGTDDQARTLEVPLSFLEAGRYSATIFEDDPEADLDENPESVRIRRVRDLTSDDAIEAVMERGGGQAIHLFPQ